MRLTIGARLGLGFLVMLLLVAAAGSASNEPSTFTEELVRSYWTLAVQAAIALESMRLLDETRRRATRERLTSEVTARIRETLGMETVLKTAVQEVRQALGPPEVVIRLATSPPSPCTTGGGRNGDEPAQSDGKERIG
jgi:hypothetical protein